jgi:hypothetical protein
MITEENKHLITHLKDGVTKVKVIGIIPEPCDTHFPVLVSKWNEAFNAWNIPEQFAIDGRFRIMREGNESMANPKEDLDLSPLFDNKIEKQIVWIPYKFAFMAMLEGKTIQSKLDYDVENHYGFKMKEHGDIWCFHLYNGGLAGRDIPASHISPSWMYRIVD